MNHKRFYSLLHALLAVLALLPPCHGGGGGSGDGARPTFTPKLPARAASDRVIVKMKRQPGKAATLGVSGPHVQKVEKGESVASALERLNARDDVEYAYPDQYLVAATTPNDPDYYRQWGVTRIGSEAAWAISTGGPAPGMSGSGGAPVCIIDSGTDTSHPDLIANLHPQVGINEFDTTQPIHDSLGHGTHVAGIVAAVGNNGQGVSGVAWGGNVKVLTCQFMGPGGYGTTSAAIDCFQYCTDNGAQIISASWTGGNDENPPLFDAMAAAGDAGALIVVAAGNQGQNLDSQPTYPASYSVDLDHMITVGATALDDTWASFSNYGQAVTLSAPGVSILSTYPGNDYQLMTGTSMSTPFVSGAAALLLAASGGQLNSTQLKQLLVQTAVPKSGLAGKSSSGAMLRIDLALEQLTGMPATANLVPSPTPASPRPSPPPPPTQALRQLPKQSPKPAPMTYVPCKKGSPGCGLRCTKVQKPATGQPRHKCTYVKAVIAKKAAVKAAHPKKATRRMLH